jgi:VWFA-related protein
VTKLPATGLVVVLALLVPVSAAPGHVRIATVVTDRQGHTVSGLTLKDFELREDGVVQKLESVEMRAQAPRRIAILLDEFHVDAAETENVRSAVSWFVSTRLRPDDQIIVLKPLDPLTTIRLTDEHDSVRQAIASFDGRNGVYEPRSTLEEETMGRAPTLVDASRAQVVMSALRALTMHLGSVDEGRSAILLVSNGFVQPQRRVNLTGLPDAGIVDRVANRYDVPIYAFDPRQPGAEAPPETTIDRMVSETGGTLFRGGDLSANLSRAATELDSGYTLTYTPTHGEDGKFHPIQVNVIRGVLAKAAGKDDVARTRAGYISPLPPEMAVTARSKGGPILSTRLLHKSPLIEVWSGITRIDPTYGHIGITWLPAPNSNQTVQIAIKAITGDGKLLFEGFLAPVRIGEPPNTANPDRVEFVAPPGRVQIDMTLLNSRGQKLDVDSRDIEVPAASAPAPVIFPPILIGTRTAREFRVVAADATAAPDPAREFRRTDRLVIRVPAYVSGKPVPVTARLLNRVGQLMHTIDALPETADGITQFDLPLASFAPGEYFLQFTIAGPAGPVDERVPFKITG